MILLRQKLYTRQDQKVIKELHKATNGFRKLPEGYKNLTTKDYFRLSNFAEGFNKSFERGNTKSINWDEFKTVAEHLDLPETSKGAKHLIEKYNNPKLLARYRRIQKLRENPEQKEKLKQLRKEYLKDSKKLDKEFDNAVERAFIFENGKMIENPEAIATGERIEKAQAERIRKYKQDRLQQVSEPGAKFYKRQLDSLDKTRKKLDSTQKSFRQNKELFEELKKEAESWGYTVQISKNGNDSVNLKRKVIALADENPAALAHELGHIKHEYRQGARRGIDRNKALGINNFDQAFDKHPVGRWEDERGATIDGLASMKTKKSATEKDIQAAEDHLGDSFETYYHSGLSKIPEMIARRTGKW